MPGLLRVLMKTELMVQMLIENRIETSLTYSSFDDLFVLSLGLGLLNFV